jgi:hypothetical protein
MSLLPLPDQTLAWLNHAADSGQSDAQVLLHLIARADERDQAGAEFLDCYSRTIAALCRRLEALERGANLQRRVEDAEAAESDSVADTAQRITDYAAKAGLTVQDFAKAFNAPQVDDSPVADALRQAESALADVAEGEIGRLCSATEKVIWAELRCAEALAAIRLVMQQHGVRTSEFPPADSGPVEPESEKCETCNGEGTIDERLGGISTSNPAATCPDCDGVGEPRRFHRQPQAAPVALAAAPAGGLVEKVASAMGPSTEAAMAAGELPFGTASTAICEVAAWLDTRGQHCCSALLREEIK